MNIQEEAREMLGEDLREEKTEGSGDERTLMPLVRRLSERGDREALVAMLKEGAERWSYAELAERVRRLAAGLAEEGISKGDHVVLFAGGSPAWVAACLAVLLRGAVVVPLDAQLEEEALGGILADSGAKLVFADGARAEKVERAGDAPRLFLLDAGEDEERSWLRLLSDGDARAPEVGPKDPAALFYTSGTTGAPKGVPLTHGNLEFQTSTLLGADLLEESDRILLPLPLHHVYPFVIGTLTPLSAGLPIVMPRSLTGPELVRALREGEVSLIVGVPRLYDALFSGIEERAKGGGRVAATLFDKAMNLSMDLRRRTGFDAGKLLMAPLRKRIGPNLRVLASGGAPLDAELAEKLEGMGWRVAVGYGLTETSPILSLKLPDGAKLASVGRPVPGISVRVDPSAVPDEEDGAAGSEGRRGEEGEILARGPGVFSGYRNRPEETEEVLTPDGWFRTGDLGYFDDDGYLYVTGRASTLIVTEGGKNVQPEPVEEAYAKSAAIAEVGVLQKDGRLVAVVVPEPGEVGEEDPERVIRRAIEEGSRRLPTYGRVSDYAVTREPLEYTQLGKLRRHLLPERYDRAKRGDEGSAPGPVPVEEMSAGDRELLEDEGVRAVWDLLARRYAEKPLSPDSSPQLDLGIDSLDWVNLTMEMSEKTGVELGEEAIARIDTVRDLLREVAEADGGGDAGSRRVSPLEHPEEALSEEQKRYLEPLSPARSLAARALFLLNRALMKSVFGLKVEGLEGLPKEGPFVVAPNHLSYLDSFVVAAALDRRTLKRTHWAGWTGAAFGNALTRFVSRLAQAFPVDPGRAGASSLAFGAMALKRGKNLVWFPEGQRSADGSLQPFKPGIGMLLSRYRVPVVPVSVRGSYEAMPMGQLLPRPKGITVTFGAPLDPDDLEREGDGEEPKDRIVFALRESVAKLGDGATEGSTGSAKRGGE